MRAATTSAASPTTTSGNGRSRPSRNSRRSSSPRDLRARDDVVAAVGPAHPRLVPAVVVVAPKHEPRRLAADRARLVALGVQAAPPAAGRVGLPPLAARWR